jgi:hypothetical protein
MGAGDQATYHLVSVPPMLEEKRHSLEGLGAMFNISLTCRVSRRVPGLDQHDWGIHLIFRSLIGSSITFCCLRKWSDKDNAARNERWELEERSHAESVATAKQG